MTANEWDLFKTVFDRAYLHSKCLSMCLTVFVNFHNLKESLSYSSQPLMFTFEMFVYMIKSLCKCMFRSVNPIIDPIYITDVINAVLSCSDN